MYNKNMHVKRGKNNEDKGVEKLIPTGQIKCQRKRRKKQGSYVKNLYKDEITRTQNYVKNKNVFFTVIIILLRARGSLEAEHYRVRATAYVDMCKR